MANYHVRNPHIVHKSEQSTSIKFSEHTRQSSAPACLIWILDTLLCWKLKQLKSTEVKFQDLSQNSKIYGRVYRRAAKA